MRSLLLISIILSTAVQAFSQSMSCTVNRNQVGVGEHFKITYTIEGQAGTFVPPAFNDFRVLSGPNQSQSTSIINGTVTNSSSVSYVLRPAKTGKFTIAGATAQINGKNINSNSVTITVVKGGAQQAKQKEAAQNKQPGNEIGDNVFIKLLVNKRSSYIGEQITATYKIYTRLSIVDNAIDRLPSFNGFYSQDIDQTGQGNLKPEIVNGVQFNTAIIKQVVLSPQRAGEIVLEPLSMDLVLRIQDSRRSRSVFDQFFGSYKDVRHKAVSNSAKIIVEKLPNNGKPADFNGAVGVFSVNSSIDKQEVKTNEAINLKIVLKGKGNVKLLKDPKIEFPPDFEVYDPKENTKINTTIGGVEGSKTFEYLIIPRHSGEFTIPSYSFSYFNPMKKKYISSSTPEYQIKVLRGENEPAVSSGGGNRLVSKKDVALIGSDIRFIKPNGFNLKETNSFYLGSVLFWILMTLPFLVLSLLLLVRKRILALQKDLVGMKKRRAKKLAVKHLKAAEVHLEKKESTKFYEEVFRSVYGFLSNKFNIPVAELKKERIELELKNIEVSDEKIKDLISILNACEMARYAPVSEMSERQVFEQVQELIETIEGGSK
ncbi:MAG: hypothetical protein CL842_10535 [Crocinitomicaceae bacterium]|nr:hypothetical protein [Crocinitomicaceae bacterium]|tara:strand:- start:25987 stop:27783 length:1797 start_codon:yes stop_codon:yes gene_type:complete